MLFGSCKETRQGEGDSQLSLYARPVMRSGPSPDPTQSTAATRLAKLVGGLQDPLVTVIGSARLLEGSWDQLDDSRRRTLVALLSTHGDRIGTILEEVHALVGDGAPTGDLPVEDARPAV